MTRKEAKNMLELSPIIKAYTEGKIIQFHNVFGEWVDKNELYFNEHPSKYRIKPEPKLVPFTFEDGKDILGKVVKYKDIDKIAIACTVSESGILISNCYYSYNDFLEKFEFEDGSPCGKYVQK